jgi:outer membrane protein assembly factor BamC
VKFSVKFGLLALVAALSACTMLQGDKVDYKSASKGTSLEVPPDLSQLTRDSRYVIPGGAVSANSFAVGQSVPNLPTAATAIGDVRVERLGNQRWLVVNRSADQLWGPLRDFWQESGFLLTMDQPNLGIMETDWAENRAKIPQDVIRATLGKLLDSVYSTSERDKFRTRLERGADGKGTEIYISHRGMVEVYKAQRTMDQTVWQPRDTDPGLEAEFLRRLMVRLGAQDAKAKELVANAPSAQRAQIRKASDGTELLQVNEPFDRAWRRVGLALDRVGFTVEDRDRQNGLYFVRYADPEAEMNQKNNEQSLLGKLFDFSKDSKVKPEQYRVQVKQEQDASQINVLNKDGAAESSKTALRILTLLQEQLK